LMELSLNQTPLLLSLQRHQQAMTHRATSCFHSHSVNTTVKELNYSESAWRLHERTPTNQAPLKMIFFSCVDMNDTSVVLQGFEFLGSFLKLRLSY
jgi:hypothetical protein